ncbi:MAG: DNA polymerase I [Candidatus Moraniibacteriota bacterium]|nr:MAG: DNA polymerase I [Candidatus Moranbacteria bacterium]
MLFGMERTNTTLIIFDGNALVHRAYHALPPLSSPSGESVNAVYGVALTLLSVLEKFHPEYVVSSFDLPVPTFRHAKFADYKGTRTKTPEELSLQIPRVKELMSAFGIPIFERAGYEADDCVGTLAALALTADPSIHVVIVTGDNDALQLVNDRTSVFTLRKGIKDTVVYDERAVVSKYGFPPKTLVEFKGLRGDASDNIPGVPGIGEKGATDLLIRYGTLENIFAHLSELSPSIRAKLESGRDLAFLSRELGTIDTTVPLTFDLPSASLSALDPKVVETFFRRFGFLSLLKKIPGASSKAASRKSLSEEVSSTLSSLEEGNAFLARWDHAERAAFLIRPEAGTLFEASRFSCDIAFQKGETRESIRLSSDESYRALLRKFFGSSIPKITYDAKSAMKLLKTLDISLEGLEFDILIAGYLLNAGGALSLEHLFLENAQALQGGSEAPSARELFSLRMSLLKKLEAVAATQVPGKTILEVFFSLEMPLIRILCDMEEMGICLEGSILTDLSKEMEREVRSIEREIVLLAGREFNVGSPKQLSEVLFEELHIPTDRLKRTKTGISTASSELEKLKDEYPIVQLVEDYRERVKLRSTYLDVLPRLVDQNSRLHTTFQQAHTATGRLSSIEPNLQNIPIRSVWGERIRSAFVASPGKLFVGGDYSQIELRVAAHLSEDKEMCAAFSRGEDIHRRTAAIVYGVSPEVVSDEMRRKAKVFNFGILYGMGAFGLSQAAGMSREEAATFIEEYLEHFSGIRSFMEAMKERAREYGYIDTELGRRCLLPESGSDNRQIAAAADRMAINMPVQGLEADIVKLSMIATDQLIRKTFLGKASLLLQIHDELIFEVDESLASQFQEAVRTSMESVYLLRVPLVVDVSVGKNWGEI